MFDISNELSTKTIKRLYYYSVTVFLFKKTSFVDNVLVKFRRVFLPFGFFKKGYFNALSNYFSDSM